MYLATNNLIQPRRAQGRNRNLEIELLDNWDIRDKEWQTQDVQTDTSAPVPVLGSHLESLVILSR